MKIYYVCLNLDAEGFRVLTPPPSERDYLYGINKNDSILKLYEENYE